MEAFFVVLALGLVLVPPILSIVAFVRVRDLQKQLREVREDVRAIRRAGGAVDAGPAAAPPADDAPAPGKPAGAAPPPPAARPRRPRADLEVALGGKVAAFVGIAALVLGVAFFVGYAITHGWIGPGARVVLGLLAGGILIALGHLAETRGRHLQVLARVLTGGGGALLFFSVFAAHGFYDLIPAAAAAGGLFATAIVVIGLSLLYDSQIIALLGVAGAFLTPMAIGGDLDRGPFPLAYFAAVNAMLLPLGVRRSWQSLHNVAFVLTALATAAWLTRELGRPGAPAWTTGLAFTLLYFAAFTALGLVKMRAERGSRARVLDLGRLLAASLLTLVALHRILDAAGHHAWIGAAFLGMALLHVLVTRAAWSRLHRFRDEVLALLAGGLTFATLALPVQLDGVWVSLGWAVEGLVLSWFALRFDIDPFRRAGILLGLLGLGKALAYDLGLDPGLRPFLNSRFAVGIVGTGLLGLQARLFSRLGEGKRGGSSDLLWIGAAVGLVAALAIDGDLLGPAHAHWTWMLPAIALPVAALALLSAGAREGSILVPVVAALFLAAIPLSLAGLVFGVGWGAYNSHFESYLNLILLLSFGLLAAAVGLAAAFPAPDRLRFPRDAVLHVLCAVVAIFLVDREIWRTETAWTGTATTLWWAAAAMILILLGLRLQRRYLRVTALALLGLTVGKVFLVDLAGLDGLIRVAAFVGVGLILLVLSFVYQRIAPRLAGAGGEERDEGE